MHDEIASRFAALIQQGTQLVNSLPRDDEAYQGYWVSDALIPAYQGWLSSSANLIRTVAPASNHFATQCDALMSHKELNTGIPSHVVRKMYGLLTSAKEEWARGLLRGIQYIIAGAAFDEFLDHAELYHKANKKTEASVLASAVLEDTVKKVAEKHGVSFKGLALESIIDELVKTGILTSVKAKRIKGCAGVRNHALHAEWDRFDIRDVGELISGTRELVEDFL